MSSTTTTDVEETSPSHQPEESAPTTVELIGLRAVWDALLAAMADEERATRLREDLTAIVQKRMADAEIGLLDGRPVVSYKNSERIILRSKLIREQYPDVARECEDIIPVRTFRILGS